MKIIFLGDSLTWGKYGGDFVAEVATRLPDHNIVNMGQGGNTVLNLLARLDEALAEEPDGIFVMVGGNDTISYTQPATRRYYEQVQKVPDGMVTPEQFAAGYRDLLTHIQVAHVLAWVGLEPSEYSPEVVDTMRQFNDLARDAAESLNIPVLDLMATMQPESIPQRPPLDQAFINLIGKRANSGWNDYETERQRNIGTFTFDGMHLTPDAAKQVADQISTFISDSLR